LPWRIDRPKCSPFVSFRSASRGGVYHKQIFKVIFSISNTQSQFFAIFANFLRKRAFFLKTNVHMITFLQKKPASSVLSKKRHFFGQNNLKIHNIASLTAWYRLRL
jgi:hypothetical protein